MLLNGGKKFGKHKNSISIKICSRQMFSVQSSFLSKRTYSASFLIIFLRYLLSCTHLLDVIFPLSQALLLIFFCTSRKYFIWLDELKKYFSSLLLLFNNFFSLLMRVEQFYRELKALPTDRVELSMKTVEGKLLEWGSVVAREAFPREREQRERKTRGKLRWEMREKSFLQIDKLFIFMTFSVKMIRSRRCLHCSRTKSREYSYLPP